MFTCILQKGYFKKLGKLLEAFSNGTVQSNGDASTNGNTHSNGNSEQNGSNGKELAEVKPVQENGDSCPATRDVNGSSPVKNTNDQNGCEVKDDSTAKKVSVYTLSVVLIYFQGRKVLDFRKFPNNCPLEGH